VGPIKAVIRLEMKKTFFAKRGLWIYLVAALPVLLFIAYAIATSSQQNRSASVAQQGVKRLAYQDLLAVKPGMTSEEVMAILGKPPITFHWTEDRPTQDGTNGSIRVNHEDFHYSDGPERFVCGIGKRQSREPEHPARHQFRPGLDYVCRGLSVLFSAAGGFFRMPRNLHELISRGDS